VYDGGKEYAIMTKKPDPSTKLAKVISMLWINRITVGAVFVALTACGAWAKTKWDSAAISEAHAVDTRSSGREDAMEGRMNQHFSTVEKKVDIQGAKIDLLVEVITGRDPKTIAASTP